LCESYVSRQPLRLPAFTAYTILFPRDELPSGPTVLAAPRRSEGTHSDPTYIAAIEHLYGPPNVPLQVPIMVTIDYQAVLQLLAGLPAHLERPVALAYLNGLGYLGAGERLRLSRNTVARRCTSALEQLCSVLYGDRWLTPPAA
jgi:hypothetical protein